MSTTFHDALAITLQEEGGISDHAADKGGLTSFGVTQASYDKWRTKHKQPKQSVTKISLPEVDDFYEEEYWLANQCDKLPRPLAILHFDATVNHGAKNANRILQRAVGAKIDGVIGPETLKTAAIAVPDVVYKYGDFRSKFFIDIVRKDLSQIVFLYGWLMRVRHLEAKLKGAS